MIPLPLQLLTERDESLSFSTDITTESGKQTLELYYYFAKKDLSKTNFEKFAKQLRTIKFSNQPLVSIGNITNVELDHFNKKFSPNLWKININFYLGTGKWLTWGFINCKAKILAKSRPSRTIPKFLQE